MTTDVLGRLDHAAQDLQEAMAQIDLLTRPASGHGFMEALLLKKEQLAIRMDGNRNHARAHIHVDYGADRHMASYAVDDGSILAGKRTKYHKAIQNWVLANKSDLITVWTAMRTTGTPQSIVASLAGSQFG